MHARSLLQLNAWHSCGGKPFDFDKFSEFFQMISAVHEENSLLPFLHMGVVLKVLVRSSVVTIGVG